MLAQLKEKLGVIAGIIGAAGTIVGAALTIDARYASAADVAEVKQLAAQQLKTIRVEQAINTDTLRKQNLEDRLFELRLRSKPTQLDKAMIERYEDQLRETNERINTNQSLIR